MKLKISLILLFIIQLSFSQTKNKKEERIPKDQFPDQALELINELPTNCKRIRFYKETDGDKKSYEVKFKYQKKNYSIEFSEDGILEDIEVLIKFKNLEKVIRANIKTHFKSYYKTYKLIKVQAQYLYQNDVDFNEFTKYVLNNTKELQPNFEIIAEVREVKKREIKEFTYNSKGEFIKDITLEPESYEHVLY
ncbi:MAG: hypothetical protein HRU50_11805 [Winogradskyella sp.]|uniref:hypothetical protein n=1 Tax=Winogradskyella sp. TaxID=1883156 RepID=UPI0025FC3E4B|nr:hypothetical protein [Winogradskyella sp.]NRB60608.1 hypothetical protein [Winogradskyella sp.]